ncbi:hypothetical protein LCGC14_0843360 [marine sediment metagenome]|uniref:Transketolase-like pyrimidine-binding domain-containing protein n=1 Tax=marine sediment metagenome TaxID=412755 RepID=A0A0F9PXL3_9ZZZZ
MNIEDLKKLAKLIRYYSLISTSEAGSGHPTSSFSATELMTALMFGGIFRYDLENPEFPNNDRLIFSKGHASPLFYSLYAAAGKINETELKSLRKFGSHLEGHPTMAFPYTEVATGSLGQGLSIGLGMALNAKYLDNLPNKTYVLLGDSEMAEGSQWESIQVAAHYKLNNLIGVIDVNRLGQTGETMYGHDLRAYESRISSFGWQTYTIEGHSFEEILEAYKKAQNADVPVMIIAKTIKGKGASFLEDKNGWHGKALDKELEEKLLAELGEIDKSITGKITAPENKQPRKMKTEKPQEPVYEPGQRVATRKAYGESLVWIADEYPEAVALDAEVSNSTYSELLKKAKPERFFEMFIAEQNMVGTALGLARRGKIPFVSTFGAFLSRAYDQIRMSQYSGKYANIKFVGSHTGVSIGQDGPSQMALADIALFRALIGSTVLYPADAVATKRLVKEAAEKKGIVYLRLTRKDTPVIYNNDEPFPLGGSKTLKESSDDEVTIVAAGITLYEALAAHKTLKDEGVSTRIIDLYSIKPIDEKTLLKAAKETGEIITVEDHYKTGGLGEAVMRALATEKVPVHSLAVGKLPRSGTPDELMDYEEISRNAIVRSVKKITSK